MVDKDIHANLCASKIAAAIGAYLPANRSLCDPAVMERVGAFLADLGSVLKLAVRSGLTLAGFRTDKSLELYFDVYSGSAGLGAISKGWDDPGVRVLDLLYVTPSDIPEFRSNLHDIMDAATSQGCCLQVHHAKNGGVELEVWTPVYGDPAPGTLKKALKALATCRQRIVRLCAVSQRPPNLPTPNGNPSRN